MMRYNKSLQNIIDINLINYRILSGRYIVYGENGNAKAYSSYDDKLLFEGEYKNGKKNGKGKEYYLNGEVIFEGEYKNGKRNGKGKEYYFNRELLNEKENKDYYENNLIFEGEYKDGKKWDGKGYDNKNKIIYE